MFPKEWYSSAALLYYAQNFFDVVEIMYIVNKTTLIKLIVLLLYLILLGETSGYNLFNSMYLETHYFSCKPHEGVMLYMNQINKCTK